MRNHLCLRMFCGCGSIAAYGTSCETARTRSPFGPNGIVIRAISSSQMGQTGPRNGPNGTGFRPGTHRIPPRNTPFSTTETAVFPFGIRYFLQKSGTFSAPFFNTFPAVSRLADSAATPAPHHFFCKKDAKGSTIQNKFVPLSAKSYTPSFYT